MTDLSLFTEQRLERLQGMLKQRGVILPAFEIHGGSKGLYDFGPVGGKILRNVQQIWLHHWLKQGDIVEISSPTVTPFNVLEASGHVSEFTDFMVDCLNCGESARADSLMEDTIPNADALKLDELKEAMTHTPPKCPECNKISWSDVRPQNLMFNTQIGVGNSGKPGFLRPETAQGMFTLFPALYRHNREKLPFGAVQIGKGYRNEISPRQGMIRLREFNMAELEYFIDPNEEYSFDFSPWSNTSIQFISDEHGQIECDIQTALDQGMIRHPTVAYFIGRTYDFLTSIGIHRQYLRFRQHQLNEMAHYAQDCWDAEIFGSYGWIECVGIAHRGCYDLESHEQYTGKQLRARRNFDEPKIVFVDGWTINPSTAGPAFRQHAGFVKSEVEKLPVESTFPIEIQTTEGELLTILSEHVKRDQRQNRVTGEWFTPHVVEPAFGIDRIIWHVLDHAYEETEKEGEPYTYLHLEPNVSPIDYCVFPLYEKDGMEELAKKVQMELMQSSNLFVTYDGSGSIGRRYARADEIGVPYCITIDQQSIEDKSFTVRNRDDGSQRRARIEDILQNM